MNLVTYAEVAVNSGAPLRQTFTYHIPEGLRVDAGHAVYVPFGSRTLQGIVMEVSESTSLARTRDVEALIDPRPLLSNTRLNLARWIAEYYLAPLFDCLSLLLPPGFKRRPLTVLRPLVSDPTRLPVNLTLEQREALALLSQRGSLEETEVKRLLGAKQAQSVVRSLAKAGLVGRTYELAAPSVRPKVIRQLRLLLTRQEALEEASRLRDGGSSRALRKALLLEALAEEESVPVADLKRLGLTPALLRQLEEEGIAAHEQVTVVRDPLAGRVYERVPPPPLTPDQEAAREAIVAALERAGSDKQPEVFLLHGVTGSGKTEVYLSALDRAIALGKRGIVLVPEIGLTPQTIRRFGERFPGQVAVMHSRLSLGEHFDMWREVRDGRYQVVIGPRSALFAPQPDLGLVVLDEEHEWTYKQQEGQPRYHARRVAEELCRRSDAVLVLGSATPDVESYFRAEQGHWKLLELPHRLRKSRDGSIRPAGLPPVDVVDLRREIREGNRSIFSRPLEKAMRLALAEREQIILFLNRRGSASFVQCQDCGHVPACNSCGVSFTYHSERQKLSCHYCRRQTDSPAKCPVCPSLRIRLVGLGTERVEEDAQIAFPEARVVRWDGDVARGRGEHEAVLAGFLAHESDVLVGTQIVAKGLHVPLVTLVGVISADVSLHFPDFRAGERTFQLLEQVAGRAGRGATGGRAVIQTYNPNHYAIGAAAEHDFHSLYEHEIRFRRKLGYPPFSRLIRLTLSQGGAAAAQEQAMLMARRLKEERDRQGLPDLDVIGPSPAFIPRIHGRWRWNLLLRGSAPEFLLREVALSKVWTVDVDPVSVM